MTEPTVRIISYAVSALPENHREYQTFALSVESRGWDTWAVVHHGFCLNWLHGTWEYEPIVSNRKPEWIALHRWDSAEQAIEAAKLALVSGLVVVNSHTVKDGEVVKL